MLLMTKSYSILQHKYPPLPLNYTNLNMNLSEKALTAIEFDFVLHSGTREMLEPAHARSFTIFCFQFPPASLKLKEKLQGPD